MFVQTLEESPRNFRGGQVSYLLLTKGQFGSTNLTITWVEGGPGSEQPLHAHPNEQAYVIVRGRGVMKVAGEEQEVAAGTLVFIPPGAGHAIRNTGEEPLVFVSAASPSFDLEQLDSTFAYEPAAIS